MPYRCLFHVHSNHSYDSMLSVRTIVAKARDMGVYALIVTDHNTIAGAREVRKLSNGNPLIVPIAAEYQSEKGDIVGIFLKEEIRSQSSSAIVEEIHSQGGVAVLPHPYKGHALDNALLAEVDVIETFNSRCSEKDNAMALQLAQRLERPVLAGADAHCGLELGAAIIEFQTAAPKSEDEFRDHLLHAPRRLETRSTWALCRPYSQMIKAVKTRDPLLFLYQAKRMALLLANGQKQ